MESMKERIKENKKMKITKAEQNVALSFIAMERDDSLHRITEISTIVKIKITSPKAVNA